MWVGHRVQGRGRSERLSVFILHAENIPSMGIDHQAHGPSAELIGHLETLALVGDGAVLAHLALDAVVEQLIEPRRAAA